MQQQIVKGAAVSSIVASMLAAGNANAALEVAQLAAGDNRFGIIAFLFLPVVGWVRKLTAAFLMLHAARISSSEDGLCSVRCTTCP